MAPNGCGNTVAQKSTTSARCGGRVEREAQIDLVGLQVEDRVAIGRLGKFELDIEQFCDVVGHLDGEAGPGPGREVLVEIG